MDYRIRVSERKYVWGNRSCSDLQRFLDPILFTHTSSLGSSTSYPPSVKLFSVMEPGNVERSSQLNGFLNRFALSLFSCTIKRQCRSPSGKMEVKTGALLGASALCSELLDMCTVQTLTSCPRRNLYSTFAYQSRTVITPVLSASMMLR